MAKISLETLRSIDGYVASALVDIDSGMLLAGDGTGVNLRQHMMQTMAKLMEQGHHFVMGKQRRLATDRFVEITGQVRHRMLQAAVGAMAAALAVVHPGPAALFRPCV